MGHVREGRSVQSNLALGAGIHAAQRDWFASGEMDYF